MLVLHSQTAFLLEKDNWADVGFCPFVLLYIFFKVPHRWQPGKAPRSDKGIIERKTKHTLPGASAHDVKQLRWESVFYRLRERQRPGSFIYKKFFRDRKKRTPRSKRALFFIASVCTRHSPHTSLYKAPPAIGESAFSFL